MADENRVIHKSLHSQAFWLYSTIVALSIKEALVGTVPYLITPQIGPVAGRAADFFRLLVFLIVIIRFYLGSTVFFEYAHVAETADKEFPSKSYALDFLFGILHFLLFFVWALSIDIHNKPLRLFPGMLAVILLYDVLWLIACHKYDTQNLMKLWSFINGLTVIGAAVLYLLTTPLLNALPYFSSLSETEKQVMAEQLVFALVIIMSVLDIWELISKKRIFKGALLYFLINLQSKKRKPIS